jgi:hypothetical protein
VLRVLGIEAGIEADLTLLLVPGIEAAGPSDVVGPPAH